MATFEQRIDEIVRGIVADCADVNPPLDKNEITQHVVDQLSEEMQRMVPTSLNRLVQKGLLLDNSDHGKGRPHRYWLPQAKRGSASHSPDCL